MKSHESQSTSQKNANLDAFIAKLSSCLDGIAANLTPKYVSSETHAKGAKEEVETEDDMRHKRIYAQHERVKAQIKSLGT